MGTATERFEHYVSLIAQQLGHADRVEPFRGYCTGLLLPVQRKSVEPMAAHLAPTRVRSEHQRLHHFVADAAWSDDAVLAAVRDYVLEEVVPRAGEPEALLIDDTGFPKQGTHSVGVARQYCGQLGKQDNCQVAVSVSLANEQYSLPVAYRLYLPKEWAADPVRRAEAKVPETVAFATKPAIAVQLLEQLQTIDGLPKLVWSMPVMAWTRHFGRSSRPWVSAMWSVSLGRSACGAKGRPRCRRSRGWAAASGRRGCATMPSTDR